MKTKAKHGFRWGSLRFIGVWVLGYIAVWMASLAAGITLLRAIDFEINAHVLLAILAIGPTMLQAIVQKWVTQRGLGRDMRGWLRASLFGGIAATLLIDGIQQLRFYPFSSETGTYFFLALVLVPPALVQAWWLRKRVKSAWLWTGAALANVVLFNLPFQWRLPFFGGSEYFFAAIIALMMGIVSGGVMRYLWTQPQADTTEKSKHAAQADAFAAPERLAHIDTQNETELSGQHLASQIRRDTSAS